MRAADCFAPASDRTTSTPFSAAIRSFTRRLKSSLETFGADPVLEIQIDAVGYEAASGFLNTFRMCAVAVKNKDRLFIVRTQIWVQ